MKIQFYAHRGNALLSRAIRLLSPRYNHISIRMEDTIFEAHWGEKIQPIPYKEWKGKKTVVAKRAFEVDEETFAKVFLFLMKQRGKGYDKMGIFSFLWIYFKPTKDKWYCSELAQVALYKMLGIRSTSEDYNQKVSPYQFWRNLRMVRR